MGKFIVKDFKDFDFDGLAGLIAQAQEIVNAEKDDFIRALFQAELDAYTEARATLEAKGITVDAYREIRDRGYWTGLRYDNQSLPLQERETSRAYGNAAFKVVELFV